MLICNNCSHVNDDGVTQCGHCHMRGNFTYRESGDRRSDEPAEPLAVALCLNCGSPAPGEGPRCVHCRFPRPVTAPSIREKTNSVERPTERKLP